MTKTAKEMAFLRGLYVENEWTSLFTDAFDKQFKIGSPETFLYLNAGTGNHALGLCEKFGAEVEVFAVCETKELQKIAQEKAIATKSRLDFSTELPLTDSNFVLADASFVSRDKLDSFVSDAIRLTNKEIVFFLPVAGSFAEVYSLLWEIFLEKGDLLGSSQTEKLISDLPTASGLTELFKAQGLKKVKVKSNNEFLDFENGGAFMESPLIKYFLLPNWLDYIAGKERAAVIKSLAKKIDEEYQDLSFRVSVKTAHVSGKKP